MVARFYTSAGVEALRQAFKNKSYDAVHVDMIAMAAYVRNLPRQRSILSINDALSLTLERMAKTERNLISAVYFRALSAWAAKTERSLLPLYRAVHVLSRVDAAHLQRHAGLGNLRVINTAVPQAWFAKRPCFRENWETAPPILFASGFLKRRFMWEPLSEFLRDPWRQILTRYPGARMILVGRNPHPTLRKAAEAAHGVELYERAENYDATLQQADVALFLESSGPSGTKTRVIQAMAAAKPIVATPIMIENTGANDGIECAIVDDPSKAGDAVLTFLDSVDLRRRVGLSALALVQSSFCAERIGSVWEQLYATIAFKDGGSDFNSRI
jgi:glycosyltransferase involved in cell wall biosynthesis